MGQNELLITELILCNMFNDLEPAEIAALLSGLVFQAKIQGEPVIPENLKKVFSTNCKTFLFNLLFLPFNFSSALKNLKKSTTTFWLKN